MKLKKIAASIAAGLLIMLPCADIGTSGSISASNTVSAYAVYENELDNYDDYDEYENDEYSGTESDSEVDSDSERNPLKSFIISLIIGIVIAARNNVVTDENCPQSVGSFKLREKGYIQAA